MNKEYTLPSKLIVFISGIPGVGKTTISYELLKKYKDFRLVEETDVIREILRGYNLHMSSIYNLMPQDIYSHEVFLSYEMAKQQCNIMKNSILNIVKRQQRKEIPSIINGVHIIPEVLYPFLPQSNILYINLYVDSKEALWNRLKLRNPKKYIPECIPYLYQANIDLHNSLNCIPRDLGISYSINVSALSVQETLSEINKIFVEFNQNN